MKSPAMILGVLLLVGGATSVEAQAPACGCDGPCAGHPPYPGPRWPAAYHAGFHWSRPATVAESHARGVAAVIQAKARYNLLTAMARLQAAHAQRLEVENRLRQIQAYFEAQRINQQARAEKRRPQRPRKAPPRP